MLAQNFKPYMINFFNNSTFQRFDHLQLKIKFKLSIKKIRLIARKERGTYGILWEVLISMA
jgi:hypothetical protein